MKIAFLVLAHNNIEIVYKQIDLLTSSHSSFFIHLDTKYKTKVKEEYATKYNVTFIKNRINVYWGGFSIVKATLSLINAAKLYDPTFDYFVLLSGQCFPIKPFDSIIDYFSRNQGKLFIECRPIPDKQLINGGIDKINYFILFDQLGRMNISNRLKKVICKCEVLLLKKIKFKRNIPYELTPYFGSQWWALPDECIDFILSYVDKFPKIVKFFKFAWAPDELFFQTIIGNSKYAPKIDNGPFRYIDWTTNGPPKTLTVGDLDKLIESKFLFARKFDSGESAILIDRIFGLFDKP